MFLEDHKLLKVVDYIKIQNSLMFVFLLLFLIVIYMKKLSIFIVWLFDKNWDND
jgi:hypothetical protein